MSSIFFFFFSLPGFIINPVHDPLLLIFDAVFGAYTTLRRGYSVLYTSAIRAIYDRIRTSHVAKGLERMETRMSLVRVL